MEYLIDRAKEPSTHVALSAILSVGAQIFPMYAPIILAVSAVFGLNGAVMVG
jgi:hypothetical protein